MRLRLRHELFAHLLPTYTTLVVWAVVGTGILFAGNTEESAKSERSPNIVFILADDLGWGDLGCYGHSHIQTPHLDNLAKQGTLFTQFYVNGSVCSPSRTAFMTGQYPARHRVHGHFASARENKPRGMPNWLDPAAPFLVRQLKNAGYATAHFGKWHLGNGDGAPEPGAYGFDEHRVVNGEGRHYDNDTHPLFRARSTGLFVDDAIAFIEAQRDRPFYLNLWTLVPHATLHPTEEQLEPYRNLGPKNVPYKGTLQIYYGSVTAMDAELGRLFAKLDELKLADNTIVLFSSDNGPEDIHALNASHSGVGSTGPFRGRKRSLYDGGVRVPFIARWPGKIPSGVVNEMSVVSAVDFLPTLTNLTGAALPGGYTADGQDFSDVLLGATRSRRAPLLWEWRFRIAGEPINHSPQLAIREGNWKLLLNSDKNRIELYNLAADPMELNNVAAANSELAARLSQQALDWQRTLPSGPFDPGAGNVHFGWPKRAR